LAAVNLFFLPTPENKEKLPFELPFVMAPNYNVLRLEDYDISPLTGFLPTTPPLQRLPNSYYEPWEKLIVTFHDLLLAGRLREYVKKVRKEIV
jgi:hypothetical protein